MHEGRTGALLTGNACGSGLERRRTCTDGSLRPAEAERPQRVEEERRCPTPPQRGTAETGKGFVKKAPAGSLASGRRKRSFEGRRKGRPSRGNAGSFHRFFRRAGSVSAGLPLLRAESLNEADELAGENDGEQRVSYAFKRNVGEGEQKHDEIAQKIGPADVPARKM